MWRRRLPEGEWPELIRRCKDGESDAWGKLSEEIRPIIKTSLGQHWKSFNKYCDFDDIVQECHLKLLKVLHTWHAECPFPNWVHVVAKHRVIELRRAAESAAKNRGKTGQIPPGTDIVDPRTLETAQRKIEKAEYLEILNNCIESVLQRFEAKQPGSFHRQVFNLIYKEEKSPGQVAVELDKPARTIRFWMHQVRANVVISMEECDSSIEVDPKV